MKILITGGLGTIGLATMLEAHNRKNEVIIFDIKNKANVRKAKKYKKYYSKLIWGDIREFKQIKNALADVDIVFHLAGLVPLESEIDRNNTEIVNVTGLVNLINAIIFADYRAKVIFPSSCLLNKNEEDNEKSDKMNFYIEMKIEAEKLLKFSKINYTIFRIGACLTTQENFKKTDLDTAMNYDFNNDLEFIVDIDLGTAFLNAAENMLENNEMYSRIYNIGGGKENGHQTNFKTLLTIFFEYFGLTACELDIKKTDEKKETVYLDTAESQELLNYQNTSMDTYLNIIKNKSKLPKCFTKLACKYVINKLEKNDNYEN